MSFSTLANTALSPANLSLHIIVRVDDITQISQGGALVNEVALRSTDNT